MSLRKEIDANFLLFDKQWRNEANATLTAHDAQSRKFSESYLRITSFQAWRTSLIETKVDANSAAFFFEAQNDLLVSHCMAHLGSFRQSLKSLRACIENVLFCLYYKDHPIELVKWELGQHKLGFSELMVYFSSHPSVLPSDENFSGIATIKKEYSILSKAVHASAKQFRMTIDNAENKLWVNDPILVSKWADREASVVCALNALLLHLFSEHLTGAAHQNLRRIVGALILDKKHAQVRNSLKVNLTLAM